MVSARKLSKEEGKRYNGFSLLNKCPDACLGGSSPIICINSYVKFYSTSSDSSQGQEFGHWGTSGCCLLKVNNSNLLCSRNLTHAVTIILIFMGVKNSAQSSSFPINQNYILQTLFSPCRTQQGGGLLSKIYTTLSISISGVPKKWQQASTSAFHGRAEIGTVLRTR